MLKFGGAEVQAHSFGRGHTGDDTMVYFPDLKVVMVSDQITNATPIVDFANGGSAVEWTQILDGVLKLDFEMAIPGRGEPKTRAEVQAYRTSSRRSSAARPTPIKAGATKDTLATQVKTDDLGWQFTPPFYASLYDELTRKLSGRQDATSVGGCDEDADAARSARARWRPRVPRRRSRRDARPATTFSSCAASSVPRISSRCRTRTGSSRPATPRRAPSRSSTCATRSVTPLYPSPGMKQQLDAKTYDTCPGPIDPQEKDKFRAHGIALASGPRLPLHALRRSPRQPRVDRSLRVRRAARRRPR